MASTRLYPDMRDEVEAYLGGFVGDFDVDGIVDDVDQDEFTEVLQRHETAGDGVDVADPVPEWRVTWTTDGGTWHERGFYTFEKTQAFARALYAEHGPEMDFCLSASRMMTVNTHSLLHAKSAGAVELAPHLLATADTFA